MSIIETRFTIFPTVVETKENSVFRNACNIDIMDEFTSPKRVNIPAIRIQMSAGTVLYPGRKNPIESDIMIINRPIIERILNMVPAIIFTFSGSSLCSLISRTLIV
jgi:hypothetical protein